MEKFVLRERFVHKNGSQHVYQLDEYPLHGTYLRASGIELFLNILPPQPQPQVQVAVKTYFPV